MQIYKQKGGICRTYAIAYAIQKQFNIIPTDEEIIAYDKKATQYAQDSFRAKYLTNPTLLKYMKKEPLAGVLLESYEWLYNDRVGKYKKLDMSKVVEALFHKEHLIFGIKIRDTGFESRVDEWGIYHPDLKSKRIDHHALYCHHEIPIILPSSPVAYLKFANSHGLSFGKNGYFAIKKGDLYSEAQQIIKIKLCEKK